MDSFKKFNDEFMTQYDNNFGYSRMWLLLSSSCYEDEQLLCSATPFNAKSM